MADGNDLPVVGFASADEWETWLTAEHASSPGVWLRLGKRGCPEPSVTYDEALGVALCFGWIDGQRNALDDSYFVQRFTPRRPGSRWSTRNRDRVAALLEQGRMRPSGLREVEAARADGRWDAAYEGSATATVPEDLQRALDANPAAAEFFARLDRQNRYSILYRVQDAKRPQTRARRIETFTAMLAEGRTLYPQRTRQS